MICLWKEQHRKGESACSGRAGRKELTGQDRQGENEEETGTHRLIKNSVIPGGDGWTGQGKYKGSETAETNLSI